MHVENKKMNTNSDETNNGQPTAEDPRRTAAASGPPGLRMPDRWLPPPDGTPRSDYPTPRALLDTEELTWDQSDPPIENYVKLGRRLAAVGDLYRRPRHADGLLLGSPEPNIDPVVVDQGRRLAAVVADRVRVRVIKTGNAQGNQIPAAHLNTMVASEGFLQQFRPVDAVVKVAPYFADFTPMRPGYNDGGPGQRFFYVGSPARVERSLDAITNFLNVMAFATNADRTNAVALALTVLLRNFWPGAKPVGVVTSTKSHGGKDTVIAFAAGRTPKVSVDYQPTDWAFRQGFYATLQACPETGVVNVENARVGKGEKVVASATLERFLTDPEPVLHSTKHREAMKVRNHLVVTISTNFGTVSEDLMNRALPIHLNPVGNVADRRSPIGNPKLEYLPANLERIEGALRQMIEVWIAAGRPLDDGVKHPYTEWARTVGGILQANGFSEFLANYGQRRTVDDPLRQGLGLLGAARPDEWLRPDVWARLAQSYGLDRRVIPDHDRETDMSRARGIGVVLSAHRDETFEVESDDAKLTIRLEKRRGRFDGEEPSTRYRFSVVAREALPEDADEAPLA
jgi:hypothetical protein